MITLETERLTLRMPRESDFDAYAEMFADPEVMRHIGDGQPVSRPMAWRKLAMIVGHWTLRGYGLWTLEERTSGTVAGYAGYWNPEGWPGVELAWTLRRACWGRGFATEAARVAMPFGFTQLDLPQIISLIRPENTRSIQVAQRLGARLHDSINLMGNLASVYRITRAEWAAATRPLDGQPEQ